MIALVSTEGPVEVPTSGGPEGGGRSSDVFARSVPCGQDPGISSGRPSPVCGHLPLFAVHRMCLPSCTC